jgi:signal peptidase I
MMPMLTAAVLAAFVAYSVSWFLGMHEGSFPLLLLLATVITGIYWLAEKLHFLPQRRAAAERLAMQTHEQRERLQAQGIAMAEDDLAKAQSTLLRQPWWLDWTAGLFPVIAAVFILRSFIFEPFKIPSGSMIPTLMVGDLILVNKYHYGLRLPVLNVKVTAGSPVQRGDVVVFRFPPNPKFDYIKRVVGVPGDTVAYLNKQLTINGQPVTKKPLPDFFNEDAMGYAKQFEEAMPVGAKSDEMGALKTHRLLNNPQAPAFVSGVGNFPGKEACTYTVEGVSCKVPPGHYFAMGDNRDNSMDSRYWGFVPDDHLVGKAFFVWMNFGDFKRIGSFD